MTRQSNVYLVKIHGPVAYLSEEYRVQEVAIYPDDCRLVYINRGSAGGISIKRSRCEILACVLRMDGLPSN